MIIRVAAVVAAGALHTVGAARRDYNPDYRGISIGFRLVRNAE